MFTKRLFFEVLDECVGTPFLLEQCLETTYPFSYRVILLCVPVTDDRTKGGVPVIIGLDIHAPSQPKYELEISRTRFTVLSIPEIERGKERSLVKLATLQRWLLEWERREARNILAAETSKV